MSGIKGAEFSDLQPKNALGALAVSPFVRLDSTSRGLDTGVIQQVSANNAFRIGQQLIFWLGISNPLNVEGDNWFNSIRLKLWWARPNMEYRQGGGGDGRLGSEGFLQVDDQVFGGGPNAGLFDNRYVWIPSPKRLDITEYQTAPPDPAEARTSDSLLLDDVLKMDLRDPTDATYIAQFPAPQVVSRWGVFMYPAMGYALGFTWDGVEQNQVGGPAFVDFSLTWAAGTLSGTSYQESIG